MRYLGGKARLGKRIVAAILADLGVVRVMLAVDLCSGPGNVTHRLAAVSDHVIAVETHPGLVELLRAVQAGWIPPENVSEAEYKASFALPVSDPLAAFLGFACSFGGDWRRGYARPKGPRRYNKKGDNYAWQSSTALRRDSRPNVEHVCADARAWVLPPGVDVVYCDPPYEGTAGYGAVSDAASEQPGEWWARLAALARAGVPCFMSEYAGPPEGVQARLVWSAPVKSSNLAHPGRIERLWRVLG